MKNGNVDIYYAFIELGLNLLNENGKLGYITPNSHFNTASGKNIRKLLKKNLASYKGLEKAFAELGISENARAEELTPEVFAKLFKFLKV